MAGFLKLSRDGCTEELLSHYPNAFLLLTQIAMRARRASVGINPLGLESGEALVGDFRSIGLTEQTYRTAKEHLAKLSLATFRATNKGTVAKIVDTRIYDINSDTSNDPENGHSTNEQRAGNERVTTKKNVKKEKKVKKAEPAADAAAPAEGDKAPESPHQKFIRRWEEYYEEKFKAKYHFQGGKDGQAVKTLLGFFPTLKEASIFVMACQARMAEGYPFENCTTLAYVGSNISLLQARLAMPPKEAGKASNGSQKPKAEKVKMV